MNKQQLIKSVRPKAYTGWSDSENEKLILMCNMGCKEADIAQELKRTRGAIGSQK